MMEEARLIEDSGIPMAIMRCTCTIVIQQIELVRQRIHDPNGLLRTNIG